MRKIRILISVVKGCGAVPGGLPKAEKMTEWQSGVMAHCV